MRTPLERHLAAMRTHLGRIQAPQVALHENPPHKRAAPLPGQQDLFSRLEQRAAQVQEQVAELSLAAPSAPLQGGTVTTAFSSQSESATPSTIKVARYQPDAAGESLGPHRALAPRFAIEHSRKGFDIFDRLTNSRERHSQSLPLYSSLDAAEANRENLERAWRQQLEQDFPQFSAEAKHKLLDAAYRARILLRPARVESYVAFEAPKEEVFAEGAVESANEQRSRRVTRFSKPAAHAACETVSLEDANRDGLQDAAPRTFEVLESKAAELKKKIETWNRKAQKHGLSDLSISMGDRYKKELDLFYEIETVHGTEVASKRVTRYVVPVTIQGEIPRLNGWQFVAKLVPVGDQNVVNSIGDIPVPLRFRARTNTCDHCRTTRRRSETFVLYHEQNKRYAQVGRSCLKDFLPGLSVDQVVSLLEEIPTLRLDAGESFSEAGGHSQNSSIGLEEWLSHVALAFRHHGWSKIEPSTKQRAYENYILQFSRSQEKRREYERPSDADETLAKETIAYWRSRPAKNDFELDLLAIAKSGMAPPSTLGKSAWMIAGYQRDKIEAQRQAALAEQEKNSKLPKHIGSVGETIRMPLKVVDAREISGQFPRTLYRLNDEFAREVVWFSKPEIMQLGHTYVIAATVDKHGEYRGKAQTQITRGSVIEDVTPIAELPPAKTPQQRALYRLIEQSRAGLLGPFHVRFARENTVYVHVPPEVKTVFTAGGGSGLIEIGSFSPRLEAAVKAAVEAEGAEHRAYAYRMTAEGLFDHAQRVLIAEAHAPGGIAGFVYKQEKGRPILVLGSGRKRIVVAGETPEAFVRAAIAASPALAHIAQQALAQHRTV